MPKVLIAVASRHGSTEAIAHELARIMTERGLAVDVRNIDALGAIPGDYEAVMVGSAVYSGRWLASATAFIQANREVLTRLPVWLFSSGPIGAPALPAEVPVDVTRLISRTSARGHMIFTGKLDRQRLNFAEKAVVLGLGAQDGDYRDWQGIRNWANQVADELAGSAP